MDTNTQAKGPEDAIARLDGVLKDLAAFTLVYNLVRMVMLRAAHRQKVPLDRISFVEALRWLCAARDGRELADLVVNPKRPGRFEAPVLKRRKDGYPVMTKPRDELRQAIKWTCPLFS